MDRRRLLIQTARAGSAALCAILPISPHGGMGHHESEAPGSEIKPDPATGPLRVDSRNPRYFTDGSGKAIYLTGSHTWANFQDMGVAPIPRFDWPAYLDMMVKHNHNFMRFWHWLQAAYAPWTDEEIRFDPLPYLRTGPGLALDGRPKFDLMKFNPIYFQRLRSRLIDARDHGIYAAVQLFQSFSEKKKSDLCNPWLAHPYNAKNNINGFDGEEDGNGQVSRHRPEVQTMQATYLRKVVDTVNDLPNVLYEVINEGGDREWDWWVVDFVHKYETSMGPRHPVGLTGYNAESLTDMLKSPCDWLSPGSDAGQSFKTDPPAWSGERVGILDTDHLWGAGGSPSWVWKGFTRGYNILLMDSWVPIPGHPCGHQNWASRPGYPTRDLNRADAWVWEPVRKAMGNARTYAKNMNLSTMVPRDDLSSSRYCLADPAQEYLVYLPEGDEVLVDLTGVSGTFSVEWMHPVEGNIERGGAVEGGAKINFAVPFGGAAVLYFKRV